MKPATSKQPTTRHAASPTAPEIDVVRAAAGRLSDALDDAIADLEAHGIPHGADAFAGLQLALAADGSAALPLLQVANPRRAVAIEEALVRVSTGIRRVQARNGDASRRAEFAAARRDAGFYAGVTVDDLCDAFATARDELNDAVLELPDRLALRMPKAAPRDAEARATGEPLAMSGPIPQHLIMGWTELTKAAQARGVRNDAGGALTPSTVRKGVRRGFGRLAALREHCVRGGVTRAAACRILAEIATLPSTPRTHPQERVAVGVRDRQSA